MRRPRVAEHPLRLVRQVFELVRLGCPPRPAPQRRRETTTRVLSLDVGLYGRKRAASAEARAEDGPAGPAEHPRSSGRPRRLEPKSQHLSPGCHRGKSLAGL